MTASHLNNGSFITQEFTNGKSCLTIYMKASVLANPYCAFSDGQTNQP